MDIKSVNADKEWLELLDVFSKRDLRNVLRNAASRTGRSVKDIAVWNLSTSTLANATAMKRGIRIYALQRRAGSFQLTLHPHGKRHVSYVSRHNKKGIEKPVLLFAEEGTKQRQTLRGFNRGRMPAYHHLIGVEQRGTQIVEDQYASVLEQAIERKRAKLGWTTK